MEAPCSPPCGTSHSSKRSTCTRTSRSPRPPRGPRPLRTAHQWTTPPPPAGAAAAAQQPIPTTPSSAASKTSSRPHLAQRLSRNPTPISLSQARGHTAHTRSRFRWDRARGPTPWASSLHSNDPPPPPLRVHDKPTTCHVTTPSSRARQPPPQPAQRPGWRLTVDAFAPDCNSLPPALLRAIHRTIRRAKGRPHRW